MRKPYLIALGLVAFCGCVALGIPALSPPTPGLTRENFERVQVGMTQAEVEGILGKDGYVVPETAAQFRSWTLGWSRPSGYGPTVFIDFKDGRVYDKSWEDQRPML